MKDFNNYKFRCSGLANLLVEPRSKSETLSETTKAYLREIWILEVYGRVKYISSKYMDKGIAVESDSLDLVKAVTGKTFFKNQKQFENEYITGTPDVIDTDSVTDIKSSWDLWTFAAVTEDSARKTYYPQVLGYMWLTNKKQAHLNYCLVNTPAHIVDYELYKLKANGTIKDTTEDEEKALLNFNFDDIDAKKRLKAYSFEFSEEIQSKLIEKIKISREYLNSLSL